MFVRRSILVGCLIFIVLSCRKYNLKQPAFISFNSEITAPNADAKVQIKEGAFYLDNIKVVGERLEGAGIEIEQAQNGDKLVLSNNSSLGVGVDIPQGDYTKFEVKLDLNQNELPAMELRGTFVKDGTTYPLVIYWRDNVKLSFLYEGVISIEKKKTYETKLTIDQNKLFDHVDWSDAILTPITDGEEMRVTSVLNESVFEQITYNLKTALLFKIQE